MPFPVALAFVVALGGLIPMIGATLGAIIGVTVALFSTNLLHTLLVAAFFVAYQQLENYVLSPRISQKTMELNAGVAFAAAMAGGAVGGFIGAFFALPIAAIIQSFLSTYSRHYELVESDLTRIDRPTSP